MPQNVLSVSQITEYIRTMMDNDRFLCSIAANDPLFLSDPNNNWSGQPQGLTYQRAIRALENYGYYGILPLLGRKLCEAVGVHGHDLRFTQQYDPYTMIPSKYGDGCYGPAILAFLEYTNRMYGVKICRDRIIWSAVRDDSECEYTQQWGDCSFTYRVGREMCEAFMDNRRIFTCGRGLRSVTTLDGEILDRSCLG